MRGTYDIVSFALKYRKFTLKAQESGGVGWLWRDFTVYSNGNVVESRIHFFSVKFVFFCFYFVYFFFFHIRKRKIFGHLCCCR